MNVLSKKGGNGAPNPDDSHDGSLDPIDPVRLDEEMQVYSTMLAHVNNALSQTKTLKERVTSLEHSLEAEKGEVADRERRLVAKADELAATRAELARREDAVAKRTERITDLEREVETYRNGISRIASELAPLAPAAKDRTSRLGREPKEETEPARATAPPPTRFGFRALWYVPGSLAFAGLGWHLAMRAQAGAVFAPESSIPALGLAGVAIASVMLAMFGMRSSQPSHR